MYRGAIDRVFPAPLAGLPSISESLHHCKLRVQHPPELDGASGMEAEREAQIQDHFKDQTNIFSTRCVPALAPLGWFVHEGRASASLTTNFRCYFRCDGY